MAFKRKEGSPNIQSYERPTSTDITAGELVKTNSTGRIFEAGDATAAEIIGIAQETIDADHPDYTKSGIRVRVDIPNQTDVFYADVGTGTATQGNVGKRYDLDSNGEIDVTSQTNNVVEIVEFISASKVVARFVND